jgi:hypothetical protein
MKSQLALTVIGTFGLAAAVLAQTPVPSPPPATQERPDARYPNPSGQDSNPSSTTVKPTKTAPPTSNPEKSRSATTGAAAKQTYEDGKKRDDAAGCSTPTDAKSARTKQPNKANSGPQARGQQTVCTTSGEDGNGARVATKAGTQPRSDNASKPPAAASPR